ncbi:MAG TPA: sugar-transfer associated ATP-grasp domain-containing protein [Caulobacteraceae bacterium]|jgi:hypothetical protein|nr:sugar-transfer associated ATP-grasp domain-containing protein [Caulobacteraceae bacterium]
MTALADALHFRDDPEPAPRPATPRPLAPRLPADASMMAVLARMSEETGVPPMRLARDFAGLSFGPGRVSFNDYVRLRLHDEAFWAGDRRQVVGQRRSRELAHQINHRHDCHALASNKVAANAYLAAFGFPVIPSLAIYAHDLAAPSQALLRCREELRAFLLEAPYPLFGKPVEPGLGAGATGLAGYNSKTGALRTLEGRKLDLNAFVDTVRENHWTGYLFQRLVQPHDAVTALCGERLATVRLLTFSGDAGPRVARACWTIPAGANASDSPSRRGNLAAQLDARTGAILRVTRGVGLELQELARHPDTGAEMIGAKVPGWETLKATAVEAARLMHTMPMIGWDMAPSAHGPMIVQMSAIPDLGLFQLTDRRGLLDQEVNDLLAAQRHAAAERAELIRAEAAHL